MVKRSFKREIGYDVIGLGLGEVDELMDVIFSDWE